MALNIIYEDNNIIIIDKPASLLVHPDKYSKTNTLVDELIKYYPQIKSVGEPPRPGIVHRLDRETSGLLICAKNQVAYDFLISQFKERKVQKKYYALVYGCPKQQRGVIAYSLAKKGRKNKEKALTYFKILKKFDNKFTLLDIEIKTGIMHQIRQHLKMLGYPIVGDKEYFFKNLKPPYPIDRLFLQAYYLKLRLPNEGVKGFKINLSAELKAYLDKLKTQNSKLKVTT